MREPSGVSRRRIVLLLALCAPLLVAAMTTTAWALDTRGDHNVRRGVEVAGRDVGGLSRRALSKRVTEIAQQFGRLQVAVNGGDQRLVSTAQKLGIDVDVAATVTAAMAAGRHDPGPAAPFRWLKALLGGREVGLRLRVDHSTALSDLHRLEGDRRVDPVEPRLEVRDGKIVAIPGKGGGGLDLDAAIAALPRTVVDLDAPIVVRATRNAMSPMISDAAATMLAAKANQITSRPLKVTAGETSFSLDTGKLRPGFSLALEGASPTLHLDPKLVESTLAEATKASVNPTGVTFTLQGGRMQAVPGHDAVVCCAADAPAKIAAALLADATSVDLPTRTVTASDGVKMAEALGIKEVVGEFTTRHPAGQPRVKNIHRMADMVRGVLIAPGDTFSINDFVGRRTAEKGFVSAPVIDEGQFKQDIGGGVSQFATTLFNAAFFAGLDIPEHKAHSIYISRYPFGREATLAYPSVDLKIHNNTPYGVVIWPTYTANSITVQLWSTRFAIGAQTAQNKKSGCGAVTITRTRLFVDGHSDQQTYRASYNCNPPAH